MASIGHELLTVAEMARADSLAIENGVPSEQLMENAGTAVAKEIMARWSKRPAVVFCGPGNNGGDGFVIARCLSEAGWSSVRLGLLGSVDALKGDAAHMAARWSEPIEPASIDMLQGSPLVVDAMFGAGLSRPLEGTARHIIGHIAARRLIVVAVDVPSGVDGDTGEIRGAAAPAVLTVTFFRKKPGHMLLPGKTLCGETVVVNIGIPDQVLDEIRPTVYENHPSLWLPSFPWARPENHKYKRGHAVIWGGGVMTGAARLAARAAMRIGAGLTTIACPQDSFAIYAIALTSILVEPIANDMEFSEFLTDSRRNGVLIGPGAGVSAETRSRVLAALSSGRPCVLDADALTSFSDRPSMLFEWMTQRCLLTPHTGEFQRLFGDITGNKVSRTREAAQRAGAMVLNKGADTVIASHDGRVVINGNAPPELATAGSGDVLAGMTLGLIVQGMSVGLAACAATWLHGAAGKSLGVGLMAEDLPEALPNILRHLRDRYKPKTRYSLEEETTALHLEAN
ncbi:ADP-dependent (S)-NAD(P)H-hydrate dehydratase / NAD(P)H-hydrate epimerase [Azospirillaceae bacterium]